MTLLDLLFPKICVDCKDEGSWFCSACLNKYYRSPRFVCAECGHQSPNGSYCQDHTANHQLTGLHLVHPFHAGPLREAIHTLKYDAVQELAEPLSRLLAYYLVHCPNLVTARPIPIPLHPTRERERGFNQAELLCRQLPTFQKEKLLIRYRPRAPQAGLSHEQRKQNITDVFAVPISMQPKIVDQTILLVDDVSTTGATLDEAARILKKAGASEVWGLVLAKG